MTEPDNTQDDNTRILNEIIAMVTPDIPADQLAQKVDDDLRAWFAENGPTIDPPGAGADPRIVKMIAEFDPEAAGWYERTGGQIGGAIATMTGQGMTANMGTQALNEALRNLGDDGTATAPRRAQD